MTQAKVHPSFFQSTFVLSALMIVVSLSKLITRTAYQRFTLSVYTRRCVPKTVDDVSACWAHRSWENPAPKDAAVWKLKQFNFQLVKDNSSKTQAQSDVPATIPTTGTNLVTVVVHKKKEVTVRELGGSMGPIWQNYYRDVGSIMYVVDVSNRCQVAGACIQLLTMLSHPQTTTTPVLLLLNKQDLPCTMSQSEIEWLFSLKETCQYATQKITVLEVSAKTGQGLDQVSRWIYENHREPVSQSHC